MKFINYDKYKLVVDPDIDFIKLQGCFLDDSDCNKCPERDFEGCIIDDIDINTLLKYIDT